MGMPMAETIRRFCVYDWLLYTDRGETNTGAG